MSDKHPKVRIYSVDTEMRSKHAVRAAIETHKRKVWRFGLALSGAADVADDLLQATCLRALERHTQVTSEARLDSWLLTICRSIWLNEVRARTIRRTQSLAVTPEVDLIAGGPDAETNIYAAEVFTKVMELPTVQRETVMLVFVEGYSYREAAGLLDVPIGTIMSRLSAARQKLRAVLQHHEATTMRREMK